MADAIYPDSLVEALAEGVHVFGTDMIKVALTAAANPPDAANAVLADLTQIAYTNLSSRSVTTVSSSQAAGLYKLVLQDLTLTAGGGSVASFRYVWVYNDTADNDELILAWDYGSTVTLNDGESITVDFSDSDGALQINKAA